jgi:hypothetical protein
MLIGSAEAKTRLLKFVFSQNTNSLMLQKCEYTNYL